MGTVLNHNNHLIKKTKYLQHSLTRKLRIRHLINSSDVSLYLNLTVYILDDRPYVSCGVDADMEGSGPVIFNQFELINKVSSS